MQVAGRNYTSTANAFTTILRTEGLGGFYKGMTANALKVVPNNAIRFAAFDTLKTFIMNDEKGGRRMRELKSRETDWTRRNSKTTGLK